MKYLLENQSKMLGYISKYRNVMIAGGLLSSSILSCSVKLKEDEVLYRVWNKETSTVSKAILTCRYNKSRCNCHENDQYKWAISPRIGNIGFKLPFADTVKVSTSNRQVMENIDKEKYGISVEYKITNPARLYFTLCETRMYK